MLSQLEDTLGALREPSADALAVVQHGVETIGETFTRRQRRRARARRRARLTMWLPLVALLAVAVVWVTLRRDRHGQRAISAHEAPTSELVGRAQDTPLADAAAGR